MAEKAVNKNLRYVIIGVFLFILIVMVLGIFNFYKSGLNRNPIVRNLTSMNFAGTQIYMHPNSWVQVNNYTFLANSVQGYLPVNATLAGINNPNYTTIKDVYLPFANNYYSGFIQMSLVAATTLLGLYAILFLELIKKYKEPIRKHKLYSTLLAFILILISALPLPFILTPIFNLYRAFDISQFVVGSLGQYATFYSYNVNATKIDVYRGLCNPCPEIITNITLTMAMYKLNLTTSKNMPYPVSTLLSDISGFRDVLVNNIYNPLKIALVLVVANLFLYLGYCLLTEENDIKEIKNE